MLRWYFEDFYPGQSIDCGSFTVDAQELDAFARRYDPQPFHIDEEAAAASIYGGVIASGWHTCSQMMRQVVDAVLSQAASLGSPGMDEVRWLKPVRAGDRLQVVVQTLSARASGSKPDRGLLHWEWRAINQHGEVVCTVKCMGMMGKRPSQEGNK